MWLSLLIDFELLDSKFSLINLSRIIYLAGI